MRSAFVVSRVGVHVRLFARLFLAFGCVGGALAAVPQDPGAEETLWYNGDPHYRGGNLLNQLSTTSRIYSGLAYDDFQVTDSAGWRVSRLWAYDDITDAVVTQVAWSVREGMSPSSSGTLVRSGVSAVTPTLVGPSELLGYNKYILEVTGLDFQLSPGTYWLAVVPFVAADETVGVNKSYLSQTYGANAVGTPPGNDGNAFFLDILNNVLAFNGDYSLGIAGAVVPEPSACTLLLLGFGLVLARRSIVKRRFN